MGLDRDQLREIALSAAVRVNGTNDADSDIISTGGDTTLGTIGDDKIRKVYRAKFSNRNNSPVLCSLYAGYGAPGGGNTLNTLLDAQMVPAYSTMAIGEDIESPVYTVRPNTSGATTTDNRIFGIVSATDCEVLLDYYDEEA